MPGYLTESQVQTIWCDKRKRHIDHWDGRSTDKNGISAKEFPGW